MREEDNKKLVGRQYSKNDNGFWANVAGSPDDIQLPVPQSDKDKWKDANHPGWRTSEADKAAQTAALEEDNQRKKHLADLIRLENDYNEAIQRRNEALNAKKNDKIDETIKQVQAKASLSEAKVAIGDDPEAALRAEKAEVIRRLEKENDEILKDEKRTALDIAYARIAAANAAEKEKKFRDAISEKGSGVKFEAMDMLGQGEDAARQKMIQELRKSKGSALTAEEEQNAGKVGSAQYQLGQIGKDRPQLQTEYLTNDLARIGGFTNSVVKADMDGINKQILEESRKTNEIFADMRNIVDKYLSPK